MAILVTTAVPEVVSLLEEISTDSNEATGLKEFSSIPSRKDDLKWFAFAWIRQQLTFVPTTHFHAKSYWPFRMFEQHLKGTAEVPAMG